MKLKFLIAIVACLMAGFAYGDPLVIAEPTAAGMWAQVDEHGRIGGWFLIFEENGTYQGAIAKMFLQPGEDPNSICTHCTGDQKNAPSLGLVIIKNMQRKGLVYQKGSVLDPRDGQVYQAKLTLTPDGKSLTLRGYLGIELFGRDQVWKRLPNDALQKEEVPPNLMPYWLALQKTSGGMMTKDGGPPYTGSTKPLQPRR